MQSLFTLFSKEALSRLKRHQLFSLILAFRWCALLPPGIALLLSSPADKKIHITTATEADFDSLPGIGPSKAKAIVDYRDAHPFTAITDIKNQVGKLVIEVSEKVLRRELGNKSDQETYIRQLSDEIKLN